MAKIGTYPSAATLVGTEELIGVQSAASVKITPNQLKQLIYNTVYKNTNYTAVAGDEVLANSSGGAITITLPATPSLNQMVVVKDVGGIAGTENITVGRNGQTIGGFAEDFIIDQSFGQAQFIYDGSDWKYALVGRAEVININDFATGFGGVNAQIGTSYEFVDADLALLVTASNGSASSYTIPDGLGAVGETLNLLNIGAGAVTISVPGTDTLSSTANDCTQGEAITIVKIAATTWFAIGGA